MLNFMKMFFIGMIGFFIGMIGFVLFGCDQNIPTEVYTISLYNNEKIQWTKAKLIFEVPTKQEFVKTHDYLDSVLKKYFAWIQPLEYMEKGFTSYAVGDFEIPLVHELMDYDTILNMAFTEKEFFYISLNQKYLANLETEIKETFPASIIDIKNLNFMIVLKNDLKNGLNIHVLANYINDIPFQSGKDLELNKKITILLSNVSMSALKEDGYTPVFYVK